jgi:cyclic pyranopterin phosphate synthase
MPTEKKFLKKTEWPEGKELVQICTNLVALGIDEIRLTGGEPLLRPDFAEIVEGLGKLPLKKMGLTTNALNLEKQFDVLKEANCLHLNISLDSLNKKTFFDMTGTDTLGIVLENIIKAKELGFNVKINTVLVRGMNTTTQEIESFVDFSARYGIEVRFLELIKIGVVREDFDNTFLPADEVIKILEDRWEMDEVPVSIDSTSFVYKLSNGAVIGFIASESRPFCSGCSRLRLGPEGKLRPCLMLNDGPSLRGLNIDEYEETLKRVMSLKPTGRIKELVQPMYQIGG